MPGVPTHEPIRTTCEADSGLDEAFAAASTATRERYDGAKPPAMTRSEKKIEFSRALRPFGGKRSSASGIASHGRAARRQAIKPSVFEL